MAGKIDGIGQGRLRVGPVQGSQEWFDERIGFFTASTISSICKPKGLGQGGITYIRKKAYERIANIASDMSPDTIATRWGHEYQFDAIEHIERSLGCIVMGSPFYKVPALNLGASPDGILSWSGKEGKKKGIYGIEIKCPFNGDNHIDFLECESPADLKRVNDDYYWQCIAGLVTLLNTAEYKGIKGWIFASYHPRFPVNSRMAAMYIREENELVKADIDILKMRCMSAKEELDSLVSKYEKRAK